MGYFIELNGDNIVQHVCDDTHLVPAQGDEVISDDQYYIIRGRHTDFKFVSGEVIDIGSALKRIKAGFNSALNSQVVWAGNTFDNRPDSRADLNGILTNVLNGVTLPAGFAWRDASNVEHPFTADDLKGLAAVMLANQWAAHQQKRTLLSQWEAATTPAQYDAIVWS